MLIKEVCKECDLTKKAIEYYEKHGLIKLKYDYNGYRIFEKNDIVRLKEISILRKLSISVSDIKSIIESENKCEALTRYKMKKELHIQQVKTEYEGLTDLIDSKYNIDEVFLKIKNKLDANILIKDKLLKAFPGNYGKSLCIHFGKYLNEKIDSTEKEIAYYRIIEFLDNVKEFPEEVEEYLSNLDLKSYKDTNKNINEIIDDYDSYMKKNNGLIEQYLKYRNSKEFKESKYYKMQVKLLEFKKNNGYYEVFIHNLKILSNSYNIYQKKIIEANERFISDYPQVKYSYDINLTKKSSI